jgi:hypothetical protein
MREEKEKKMMKTICCVCQKTKSQSGWVKQRLDCKSKMSHGYCPDCYQLTMQQVQNYPAWKNPGNKAVLNLK